MAPWPRVEHLAGRVLRRSRRSAEAVRARVEARVERLPLSANGADWQITEFGTFRGRAFVSGTVSSNALVERVQLVAFDGEVLASTANRSCSLPFAFTLSTTRAKAVEELDATCLRAVLADGSRVERTQVAARVVVDDPYHELTNRFYALCQERGASSGGRVLEIGSRARSGQVRRDLVAPMHYIGLDIVAGQNADLVGDAHRLSALIEPASIDAVFALSTFEHLAMPWKVVIEINRVLRPGGLVFVSSHQAFPLHDEPWDFWRFSTAAWRSLFNPATGFRVIDTAEGEPALIVARYEHAITRGLAGQRAFLGSAVLAEKVGETDLEWPVDAEALTDTRYPT